MVCLWDQRASTVMSCLTSAATAVAALSLSSCLMPIQTLDYADCRVLCFVRAPLAREWDVNALVGRIWVTNAQRRLNEKAERLCVPLQVNGLFCFFTVREKRSTWNNQEGKWQSRLWCFVTTKPACISSVAELLKVFTLYTERYFSQKKSSGKVKTLIQLLHFHVLFIF